jgi:hypothetical protein
MKSTGGMGPLTFISRSTAEHKNLQYINRLNAAASERTKADIERAKAGTPILPTDIDESLNVVVLNQMAIASSLSQWAAPAQGIRTLISVLRANYTQLKGMVNLQETFGNGITFSFVIILTIISAHIARNKIFSTYSKRSQHGQRIIRGARSTGKNMPGMGIILHMQTTMQKKRHPQV